MFTVSILPNQKYDRRVCQVVSLRTSVSLHTFWHTRGSLRDTRPPILTLRVRKEASTRSTRETRSKSERTRSRRNSYTALIYVVDGWSTPTKSSVTLVHILRKSYGSWIIFELLVIRIMIVLPRSSYVIKFVLELRLWPSWTEIRSWTQRRVKQTYFWVYIIKIKPIFLKTLSQLVDRWTEKYGSLDLYEQPP